MSFRRRKLLHWGVRIDPEVQKRRLQCPCGAPKKADHFICHACWVAAPAKLKNDYRLIRDADVVRALREFASGRNPTIQKSSHTISDPAPRPSTVPPLNGTAASENSSGREGTQRPARPEPISVGGNQENEAAQQVER